MQKQKSKATLLALSLGMLVAAATLPAQAESSENQPAQVTAEQASERAPEVAASSEKTTELKVKSVILPADVERGSRMNRPLLLTSTTLFAVGYIPAVVTALANSKQTSGWLGVPVVGPWIDWGPNTSAGNKVLLFGSGLLQAVGVAGIVTSFFVPESKTKKVPMMGRRRLNVSPVAARDTYMLSATGVF